ncbi:MAG: hypothetical protein QXR09_00640 [Candidatus Aenigmatarchaeota archaeon]
MKWRLLVITAIILAITGLLLFTEQGRKYAISLGSMTRGLVSTLGNFVGSLMKSGLAKEFSAELELNKEAIYGQKFQFSGAELKASGQILSMKIDGKNWEVSEKIKFEIVGSGEISFKNDGKLNLKADASLAKFNSWKTSDIKIEIEMSPESFSMDNAKCDFIKINSASGKVKKQLEDMELTVNFTQANLKLEGFQGNIIFDNEELKLKGTATNLEINGKKI